MAKKETTRLTEIGYTEQIGTTYYTPRQAQKRLGMDRDRFNNLVRNHIISRRSIPGTHGHFLKKEIDSLAEKLEYTILTANNPDLAHRFATVDDLKAINEMAAMNFGEGAHRPERTASRRRFLECNPESTLVLLDHDVIVASVDFVPLKHEAILEFREGKRGWLFPNEMIEQFQSGHRLECIIIDMMTITNAAMDQRRRYASALLRSFGTQIVAWGNKGVDIKSIDACGSTPSGVRILKNAGFTHLGLKLGTRDMFALDMDTSDLKPLDPYKQALAAWKQSHDTQD